MRLKKFSIKNFRSIANIEDFGIVDLGITCLIGANGTGKSNVLRAISYLGEESPSDEDFYAKAGDVDDKTVITAELILEGKDSRLLKSHELSLADIPGFCVGVEKTSGQDATIEFCPAGAKQPVHIRREEIRALAKPIKSLAESMPSTPEIEPIRTVILAAIEGLVSAESTNDQQNIKLIYESARKLEEYDAERAGMILRYCPDIKARVGRDLSETIEEIFKNLNIELLTFDAYEVENKAPIGQLNDRSQHPFLYDLLVLAERKASAFNTDGAKLQRIEKGAGELLSTRISKVWPTHALDFKIDKQGEELVFTVHTPQEQPIELTHLSDGEKWFLRFYTRLAIAREEGKQVLWLFDEPGRDLHSSSQIDLKRFFEEIAQSSQIIYTTHHAMMVPWHRLERMFVVENSEEKGTQIHARFWKDTKVRSPLREALSTFVGEELISGKEHIIVEGVSDYFYLQGWVRVFQERTHPPAWARRFSPLERVIVPVAGVGKIPLYCWFLGSYGKRCVNWIVIVDSDNERDEVRAKLEGGELGVWAQSVTSLGGLARGKPKRPIEEIEALFAPQEYIRVFREYYEKGHPNLDLPTEQEVLDGLESCGKITKAITVLLQERNRSGRLGAREIELDKTGIAQHVYTVLTQTSGDGFRKQTVSRFARILENVDRHFTELSA